MRGARQLGTLLAVLGTLALLVPAVALAGGSAGNSQYTNPFPTTPPPAHTSPATTPAPPQTSSATAPAAPPPAPPATTPAPSATTPAPASGEAGTTPAVTDPATVATAAGDPASTATAADGSTLPRTGYDLWEAVGLGVVLVAGGLLIRRRTRQS